ncbi:hypothetical protein [Desulfoscipio geothermicus]|uniref:Uncharacterized protein n=1 Tax=Desulfoscipio geothermicus DSM 3669 TaxID=1121426 RepID=A0A1I6DNA5_9FIRM|nr:hypothetical protein [Desulfoscipio geothermicus]SFR06945.1 hypothetical protein SAMN05660706_11412 [Desulfoscipio geothermicus DSM 3669]
MRKTILIAILTFIVGTFSGVCGHWYFTDYMPEVKLKKAATEHQEKLNQMVRSGKVLAVKPNELTIKVENSGDKEFEGKEITIKIDSNTTIQEGMDILSKPGTAFDLTSKLKKGMYVDLMVEEDKALAIHWESPLDTAQETEGV